MATQNSVAHAETRKTRIVCISDTHNQTPKLPRGDVLIHAGDLTNQGSYTELKKTMEWLEKQDFEAKIVIAGNHDITLDEPFFREHQGSWKWPYPQDPDMCRKLFTESTSITYLENTSATIQLTSAQGPRTCFTVFGSPCTPKQGNWAFQYLPEEAKKVWENMPERVDMVVTHTPPKGHCDDTLHGRRDGREGCPALLQRLAEVRPQVSICGHIHSGRGVETLKWETVPERTGSLVSSVEFWNDPGASNKKMALVDLTKRSGRRSGSDDSLTRQPLPDSQRGRMRGQPDREGLHQPPSGDKNLIQTSSLTTVALGKNEAWWGESGGSAFGPGDQGNGRHGCPYVSTTQDMPSRSADVARKKTIVINAAHLGPRTAGKAVGYNKAIVVDIDLLVSDSVVEHDWADVG